MRSSAARVGRAIISAYRKGIIGGKATSRVVRSEAGRKIVVRVIWRGRSSLAAGIRCDGKGRIVICMRASTFVRVLDVVLLMNVEARMGIVKPTALAIAKIGVNRVENIAVTLLDLLNVSLLAMVYESTHCFQMSSTPSAQPPSPPPPLQ
jgi:hypothetical protein